jgi:hypothetical protein
MTSDTTSRLAGMRARLGARAGAWAPQGVDFLAFRANGRGDDGALFEALFAQYLRGDFDALDSRSERAVRQYCDLDQLGPEAILMLLLGRRPCWRARGIEQQHSRSLTARELEAQALLATALTGGRRYLNKRKRLA